MLKLLIGPAGTGKTAAVMDEIKTRVRAKQGNNLLIVPEQYSHEAERELCRACGDSLSLYAEVFSFTGLARRVMSRQGGGAALWLDKGGRMLCMALALSNIAPHLQVYSAAGHKAELQKMLLSAVDELKTAGITAERLTRAAGEAMPGLSQRLEEMALIMEAYHAVVSNGHADPADRLDILSSQIPESAIGEDHHLYLDGFIDFTAQERGVIHALLRTGASLTVCLTVDALEGQDEVFALSRAAGRELIRFAQEEGIPYTVENREQHREGDEALAFLAENLFSYSRCVYGKPTAALRLWSADTVSAECELAAGRVLSLVREEGLRWRDIAIAVRGFEDYRTPLESVFSHYGIPLFLTKKSELLSKPLPSLIRCAYDILSGGWDGEDVVSYMRTGLTGLSRSECDTLENYLFLWQLRGGAWKRPEDWHQHPDGYGGAYDEAAEEKLQHINDLRRRLAAPLLQLEQRGRLSETAAGQAAALAAFLEELELPALLTRRAEELRLGGSSQLAEEYDQLWALLVSALEQSAAILGDTRMDSAEFGRLFTAMLSQYDVGTIPVSLDRVSAGDFDRMRRRNLRELIVLGTSDDRLPMAGESGGIFSEEDRRQLLLLDIDLGGAGEGELWREFSLIYQCLTLPSRGLTMSYCRRGSDGEELRPSFVFNRTAALFGLRDGSGDLSEARMSAPAPAMSLAAGAFHGGTPREKAAAEYFRRTDPGRYEALGAAAAMDRGRLSPRAVEALYGRTLRLSASRIDRFASCKFSYFCQYGLKAKPRQPAAFRPPEIGTFTHAVLEGTARAVKERGGFSAVDNETLREITDNEVKKYVHTQLNDFREKSERFRYLFRRLCREVWQIVLDMAEELRRSDFEPLDFELDFGKAGEFPPVTVGEGEDEMVLTGIADRVDGWVHEGKLYLRVVDYKTGKKKFSLSDVWYGMGLQMLLYLYALSEDGEQRYGREIVPAGIMYIPARSAMLSRSEDTDDETIEKELRDELRRSGILLDDPDLQEAWEKGENKRYIPIKMRYGKPTEDSVASAQRLGLLYKHIQKTLAEMAGQLRQGHISADPYYRGQQENACLNCDFFDACHFADGQNGESCRYLPKLAPDQIWGMLEGGMERE